MMPFNVSWVTARGVRRVPCVSINDALATARERAVDHTGWSGRVVTVWDDRDVVIALVTDDANGLTIHRLASWPAWLETHYLTTQGAQPDAGDPRGKAD